MSSLLTSFLQIRNFVLFNLFVLLSLASVQSVAQPKIGVTLSGGGAKGISHIGILKAIDSAGLKVDYLTGTSMGSIMGALYAAGYSGKEIEQIARDMDWSTLFSGKISLRTVNINEKKEQEAFALNLPFEKGKFVMASGIIEGQEIWLQLQELFLPVYNVKDFSKFSIPFKCVATDLGTGQAVLLDSGEIVSAIRASMTIPSIFTPVEFRDTKLVDGGVVRNFPVRDAIDMGADIVIGVNLSQGLVPASQLNTAVEILYQIGFYKDADDFQEQKKLCNILIEPAVQDYSAASFNSVDSLLRIGRETGDKYYPLFKRMADSIRNIYPDYHATLHRLPPAQKIVLDKIEINGLKNTTHTGFQNRLGLTTGKPYDGKDIARGIRQVYGSLNYDYISYYWSPTTPGHANLILNVSEKELTHVRLGIHYNTFSKIAILAGVTSRNLLFDRSKTTFKFNLSENFRGLFEHDQTFGKSEDNNFIVSAYHERFEFPIYQDFEQVSLYRSRYANVEMRLQHSFGLEQALGVGTSYEYFKLKPKISSDLDVKGINRYLTSYLYYQYNTLDRKNFSTSGWQILAKAGVVYGQNPKNFALLTDTADVVIGDLTFNPYQQLRINIENFHPINAKLTLLSQLNLGMNFNYKTGYLNFYSVGGITDFIRNQITFSGFNEYQLNTNSVTVAMVGLQYQLLKSVYGTLRVNGAAYDFIKLKDADSKSTGYLTGASASLGYNSAIGPISVSAMYSPEADVLYAYLNIGFHF